VNGARKPVAQLVVASSRAVCVVRRFSNFNKPTAVLVSSSSFIGRERNVEVRARNVEVEKAEILKATVCVAKVGSSDMLLVDSLSAGVKVAKKEDLILDDDMGCGSNVVDDSALDKCEVEEDDVNHWAVQWQETLEVSVCPMLNECLTGGTTGKKKSPPLENKSGIMFAERESDAVDVATGVFVLACG
jgi:hypothetical protein